MRNFHSHWNKRPDYCDASPWELPLIVSGIYQIYLKFLPPHWGKILKNEQLTNQMKVLNWARRITCVETSKVIYVWRKSVIKNLLKDLERDSQRNYYSKCHNKGYSGMSWIVLNSLSWCLLNVDSLDHSKGFELEIKDSSIQLSELHLNAWSLQDFCLLVFVWTAGFGRIC